jgi:hypothetical protein
MGINHYLVNPRKKEYMNFGKIGPVIPDTFYALRDDDIDVDTIPEFVLECCKWRSDTHPDFIRMIGELIKKIAGESGKDLILIGDDIYSNMNGEVDVIDKLIDEMDEFSDWYGITGKKRPRDSWYCKFDIYEYYKEKA